MRDDSVPGRAKRRPGRRPARRGAALLAAARDLGLAALSARAEIPGGVVRIGVLTDVSGGAAENSGQGFVAAAKLAVRDAGGRAAAAPVEVVAAGHRNKPGVGAALARRWLDREGVHAVVDPPFTRIALAVATIVRERDRAAPGLRRAVPGLRRAVPGADGQGASKSQAAACASVRRRLCAVDAMGGVSGEATTESMKAAPAACFGQTATAREDGRVLYNMALYQVESPQESRGAWDDERPVAQTPAAQACRALAGGGCPMPGKT